ncbi:aldose epimerase family protein [Teredinibacter purpureus]|uniref:aldose epimerase family protein n=1 Tax=Teredinibacter purpureus TaxID=2731756 RepID=UPI0005F82F75|nr:hypothetical protein [Teredinibacter purpureus]
MSSQQQFTPVLLRTRDGLAKLEVVPELGGLLNGLWLSAGDKALVSVIAGIEDKAELAVNAGFRGTVLYPFPNRLDAGQYHWLGKTQQFPVNETGFNNALHGSLYRTPARVITLEEGETESVIELLYAVETQTDGFPFQTEVRIEYRLSSAAGLTQIFKVKNVDKQAIPVGLGWHPYFQLPGRSADELHLTVPSTVHTLIDDRMLPTGDVEPFTEFQEPKAIGAKPFDDCYRLNEQGSEDETRVSLFSPEDNLRLDVWQRSGPRGYNFIQLYIPPDRKSVAVEPMTCGINAFNTGDGLVELSPGEELVAHCGVRLFN